MNCNSYDGRNSVGTFFFFWPWRNKLQCRDYFFLMKKVNCPICDESSLFCMPDWRFFFSCSRKPCHFLHFLRANDLQSMKSGVWVFFPHCLSFRLVVCMKELTKDQLHGSLFAFFRESKIHISQLIALGKTSVPRKIISVSRCGGALFFLVALQKQNRNERIKCQIDYLIL